jgi:Cd2+/Zn2+-exporting ATPase
LGNHRLIEDRGLCSPQIEARLAVHEAQGRTVTMLASSRQVLAIFAVADTIKESSREALQNSTPLACSVMLTGDNVRDRQGHRQTSWHRRRTRQPCFPKTSSRPLKTCKALWLVVAMTGDGINDAPALARSNIGFAMGGAGTDTAMEAADVVIMNDDLRRIPETIQLSRRTHDILWQNIGIALGIKAVFLVLGRVRQRHHVDGRLRRHGGKPAGGIQWTAKGQRLLA